MNQIFNEGFKLSDALEDEIEELIKNEEDVDFQFRNRTD